MAVTRNGKTAYSGKVGDTVEYLLNGQLVKRSIGKSHKPATAAQLSCRARMRMIAKLLNPVKEYVSLGFKVDPHLKICSPHNLAYRYNYRNAISGQYPDLSIDYSRVLFSQGHMPVNVKCNVKQSAEGLLFDWEQTEDTKLTRWNDQVMMMAYLPEEQDAKFQFSGAKRKDGSGLLKIQGYDKPVVLETYLSFISVNHKLVSDSVYTGRMIWGQDSST